MTFLCGRAGVCALGAVLAKHAGDEQLLNYYLVQFREVLYWHMLNNSCINWLLRTCLSVLTHGLTYEYRLSFPEIFLMSCYMGELDTYGHVCS